MAVIVKHTAFFKFIALEHMPKKCVILSQTNFLNKIHCCSIRNSQKLQRTLMSFNRRMNKLSIS